MYICVCLGLRKLSSSGVDMEVKSSSDLKVPLLPSNSGDVTVSQSVHDNDKKIRTIMFRIRGIECASCASSVETALGKLTGVESVMVSALQGQAVVRYVPELIAVS